MRSLNGKLYRKRPIFALVQLPAGAQPALWMYLMPLIVSYNDEA